MKDISGKTAFITGVSSGFGKAIAYKLASNGCNLIICSRRIERINKIAKDIEKKFNVDVFAFKLDVRAYESVKKAVKALPAKWRKIDILVNNAGLSRGLNKIQDGELRDWEEMLDTNVKGLLYVTKEIIPLMMKNNSGHIINIGSIAGHEVYPAGNVYCASKHAVDALTKGFRMDLVETPIRVSTVDPGLAETEFSLVRFRGNKEKAKNVYKGIEPLSAEDVAEAVEFVVTRDDNFVIAEMVLLPKSQASAMLTIKK